MVILICSFREKKHVHISFNIYLTRQAIPNRFHFTNAAETNSKGSLSGGLKVNARLYSLQQLIHEYSTTMKCSKCATITMTVWFLCTREVYKLLSSLYLPYVRRSHVSSDFLPFKIGIRAEVFGSFLGVQPQPAKKTFAQSVKSYELEVTVIFYTPAEMCEGGEGFKNNWQSDQNPEKLNKQSRLCCSATI